MAVDQVYPYAGGGRPLPLSKTAGPFEVREPGRCEPAPLGHAYTGLREGAVDAAV